MNIKTFIIIQCMIFYKDELYQTSSYIKLHQDVILEIKYIYKLYIYCILSKEDEWFHQFHVSCSCDYYTCIDYIYCKN